MNARKRKQAAAKYDAELFKRWALDQGSIRRAKSKLAVEADVSISMVEKLINGTYEGLPSADRRLRIATVIGKSEGALFTVTLGKSA